MPDEVYDLNPVDRFTTGTIGEPGRRVFYLQGRQGARLVTVICEKEHVFALATAVEQLLSRTGDEDRVTAEAEAILQTGMDLEHPVAPAFRAGQVNLGFDEVTERLVVLAYELLDEDDPATPSVARFWASQAQMKAFSIYGQEVVSAGRPLCVMCGEPIDPEGHFCPRRNGNRT